ncbi:MAG: ABC transporter ATP-binding protein [Rhodocyclaceae bacterium]|nr:MAG: ABC transporter ATP-binding protein [Rhodocyclaceae bacterium]
MSSDPVIRAEALSKCYHLYDKPSDRLWQTLWGERRRYYREFWALREVSFELGKGEVLGIVGRNGAGKSTLLQLVCGTLSPTNGKLAVNGRISALLELGAGFNPEFTGRENVYLNASILGLRREEIDARLDSILAFAAIGDFIDQPVKTYSSGMFIRLAFSVATCVDPDVLVIDEALSVGDGEFSRRSFERILELRDRGTTILFCSHALFQVEMLCDKAIWLDQGRIAATGSPAEVTIAYRESLALAQEKPGAAGDRAARPGVGLDGSAQILSVRVTGGSYGSDGSKIIRSRKDDLTVLVHFAIDPALPPPSVAVSLTDVAGNIVCGVGNVNDGIHAVVGEDGRGHIEARFPALPLLKGNYRVNVVLACEQTIHPYESAENVAMIEVTQDDLEQGVVHLPHQWRCDIG